MTKKRILTLVTGGFDPLHSGHIAYFEQAKDLTNYLVVGLNTEESIPVPGIINNFDITANSISKI